MKAVTVILVIVMFQTLKIKPCLAQWSVLTVLRAGTCLLHVSTPVAPTKLKSIQDKVLHTVCELSLVMISLVYT